MNTQISLLLLIILVATSCLKPENDYSLIDEIQKDCFLSKVFEDNKISREYKYNENNEITNQTIYNTNGQINTVINYTYSGGNIIEWGNSAFVEEFTYDNRNRVISSNYCEKNSNFCCYSTMEYEQGELLKSITTECTDGSYNKEVYEYLDKENGTRYIRYYNKEGKKIGDTEYIVFNEKMIWPYYFVQPLYKNPYVGIFSVNGGIIENTDLNEYGFPLKLTFTDGKTQTFEYVECR